MSRASKRDFPVDQVRRYLEPGPIVLVSSAHKGARTIMTMGWHAMMEFTPSLVGCIIVASNESFDLIRKSKECVINIPDATMIDTVVRIGNSDGSEGDKFERFGLTADKAKKVKAPLIRECFANFECKLHDARLINKYNFFIFEVVKAHVMAHGKAWPKTIHYRGKGVFTRDDGRGVNKGRLFTKWRGDASY